jgi:hypothetical protein
VFAVRKGESWVVKEPFRVPPSTQLLQFLLGVAERTPVLAGFDFPIGLPSAYGFQTGLPNFTAALLEFGSGRWCSFFDVCETAAEISIERPFYPRRSSSAAKQRHLLQGLGVSSIDDLRRRCERQTAARRAACSIFWTLGGNQVGKAAIAGWQEVMTPARRGGAHLWPFDGRLDDLSHRGGLTITETYPAEAYRHVGIHFMGSESKRRRLDRMAKACALYHWAAETHVHFEPDMKRTIMDGFGEDAEGEDRFDAALGLFGMIEVVTNRRAAGPFESASAGWEGWILGQTT